MCEAGILKTAQLVSQQVDLWGVTGVLEAMGDFDTTGISRMDASPRAPIPPISLFSIGDYQSWMSAKYSVHETPTRMGHRWNPKGAGPLVV
jgi:hypothetical protein